MGNKKIDNLIHSIGLKYNLSDHIVKQIVESQFEFTKEILNNIDFTKIKTEEDFENLKKIFHYKGFGKIYISKKTLKKIINYNE